LLNEDDSNGCTPCISEPVVDEFSLLCVSETIKIATKYNLLFHNKINIYYVGRIILYKYINIVYIYIKIYVVFCKLEKHQDTVQNQQIDQIQFSHNFVSTH